MVSAWMVVLRHLTQNAKTNMFYCFSALLVSIIMGAGVQAQSDDATGGDLYRCSGKTIVAEDVRSSEDARAFLDCAIEFAKRYGFERAKQAFTNDPQWHNEPTYIFVDTHTYNGNMARSHIYPPDATKVGTVWGELDTQFGRGEYYDEAYTVGETFSKGFVYYKWPNHVTGQTEYKASYVSKLSAAEVEGLTEDVTIGVGVYPRGVKGACNTARITELANTLRRQPSPDSLQEFVRCAEDLYQDNPATAKAAFQAAPWRTGQVYVFNNQNESLLFDAMGTRSRLPWIDDAGFNNLNDGQTSQRFRTAVRVAFDMGERFIYYKAMNPATGLMENRVDFLTRVRDRSVLSGYAYLESLVGGGYWLADASEREPDCTRHYANGQPLVTAQTVETRSDLEALVQHARCYVDWFGLEKAAADFQKPEWFDKERNIYIYVEKNAPTAGAATVYVYPPDTAREGQAWGESFVDGYGNSYYPEVSRILNAYGSGWTYYTSTSGGRTADRRLKAGYIVEHVDEVEGSLTIGSGLYEPDLPGACNSGYAVTARKLQALAPSNVTPSPEALRALQAFVRCASFEYEQDVAAGQASRYIANKWAHAERQYQSVYLFARFTDYELRGSSRNPMAPFSWLSAALAANHILPDSPLWPHYGRSAGYLHSEWPTYGGPTREVDGRTYNDMLEATKQLGETFAYYRAYNPHTRRHQNKISFLKRVVNTKTQDDLLIGAGLYLP